MNDFNLYVGTKIIKAREMTQNDFARENDKPMQAFDEPGYEVHYPDGYVSWSPKKVFETAYRTISAAEEKLFNESS